MSHKVVVHTRVRAHAWWYLNLTPDARRLVRVSLLPQSRPPASLSRTPHGRSVTRRLVRSQRPSRYAAVAVTAPGGQDGDGLLGTQPPDRVVGQVLATDGTLRAANRPHLRRARLFLSSGTPVRIKNQVRPLSFSLGAHEVPVKTLLDAPPRCFRKYGTLQHRPVMFT